MNREIKFRAWNKDDNKPIFNAFSHALSFDVLLDVPSLILMQCTGLIDRNGKDVFESDIINDDEEYSIVYWNQESFCFSLMSVNMEHEYNFNQLHMEDFIVIGNIHENPELLK